MNEIAADGLHLWRGEAHVLQGVSLSVSAGECLQVTGTNGSGKTTLLRALCGLVPLEAGRVCWRGTDIRIDPQAYHGELAYLGHDNGLKGDLTAAENLRFAVGLRRRVGRSEVAAALERLGVPAARDLPVRRLSAGQRRRVALARVVLTGAALWLLDEPGSNLDAAGHGLLAELISAHAGAGGVALVATHQALELPAGAQRSLTLRSLSLADLPRENPA
jgi:heme exporter protein A